MNTQPTLGLSHSPAQTESICPYEPSRLRPTTVLSYHGKPRRIFLAPASQPAFLCPRRRSCSARVSLLDGPALSDTELALALFTEEAGGLLNTGKDRTASEVLANERLLEELVEIEETARYDRGFALALSEGRDPPPRPERGPRQSHPGTANIRLRGSGPPELLPTTQGALLKGKGVERGALVAGTLAKEHSGAKSAVRGSPNRISSRSPMQVATNSNGPGEESVHRPVVGERAPFDSLSRVDEVKEHTLAERARDHQRTANSLSFIRTWLADTASNTVAPAARAGENSANPREGTADAPVLVDQLSTREEVPISQQRSFRALLRSALTGQISVGTSSQAPSQAPVQSTSTITLGEQALPKIDYLAAPTSSKNAYPWRPVIDIQHDAFPAYREAPLNLSPRARAVLGPRSSPGTSLPSPQLSRSASICCICRDQISGVVIQLPRCRHTFDKACLRELYSRAATDDSAFPPRCCQGAIEYEDVESFLDGALKAKYKRKAYEMSFPDRVYCSNPRCAVFLCPTLSAPLGVRCLMCASETCACCKQRAHQGNICYLYSDDKVLELGKENGWKRCPSCRNLVAVEQGCYHIMCRCGKEFCYNCGQAWKTCQCTLFYVPPED